MRKLGWTAVGVLTLTGVQIVGCQPITIPVEVGLGGSASFPVTAGVSTTKSLTAANTNTSGIDVGQGNLELEPDAITINRTNGGGKIRVQAQAAASCTEQAEGVVATCLADGLDSATCEAQGVAFLANCLSGAGQVEVTVWVYLFTALRCDFLTVV